MPSVFEYERDPDDAHYVNLALAANARLIVSRDNDLLALGDQSKLDGRDFAKRFPTLSILTPPAFLQRMDEIRREQQAREMQAKYEREFARRREKEDPEPER